MAVVLGILILLLVILLIPVRVSAGASSGKAPHAVLRWLFLSIPLFPRPKRKKTQDKSESSKPGKKKEKPKRSLKPLLAELLARFDRLSRPVQRLLRRTGLARVSLRLVVKGEDAAATALRFGRANAAVYSTVAALDRIFSLRVEQIEIIPGFAARTGGVLLLGRDTAISLRGAHRGAAARLLDADRADSIGRRQGYQ